MDTGMILFFDHRDRDQVGRLGTVRLDIQTRTRCLMRKVTGSSPETKREPDVPGKVAFRDPRPHPWNVRRAAYREWLRIR
jgi:hypothetical protein